MSVLITADIHLTDNPRDEYRWGLFEFLEIKTFDYKVDQLLILGDLTDAKDHHSSKLVNNLVACLATLIDRTGLEIIILKGNHDYIDPLNPFFGFSEYLEGVRFIVEPEEVNLTIGPCLLLPSCRDWVEEWRGFDWNKYRYIFTHATFDGCKVENGMILNGGIPPSLFKDFKGDVISGDIHVPQRIGQNITYVGAPYRVHFGDSFTPRIIFMDNNGEQQNLSFNCMGKHLVNLYSLRDLDMPFPGINSGDQVKIRVHLKRSEYPNWKNIKEQIKHFAMTKGWDLYGPELIALIDNNKEEAVIDETPYKTPSQIIQNYAKKHNLTEDIKNIGVQIVENAQSEL